MPHVADAEKIGKQLAAGGEALGGVGEKKHDDHEAASSMIFFFSWKRLEKKSGMVMASMHLNTVTAQALGHEQPVEVGAHRKADGRPARVRKAGPVGKPGRPISSQPDMSEASALMAVTHGPQLAAAQIEVAGGVVAL
jgi:hypothetical protein